MIWTKSGLFTHYSHIISLSQTHVIVLERFFIVGLNLHFRFFIESYMPIKSLYVSA